MHGSVMTYLRAMLRDYGHGRDILEVGALDVNGSPRHLFTNVNYRGIDIRDGHGVDELMAAAELIDTEPDRFDSVICCEMLEHDLTPWLTFAGIAHVLRPGGLFILTARGIEERATGVGITTAFYMHDEPADYWRFTVETFPALLPLFGFTVLDARADPEAPGVFATARKD
jgi:SAM-dependent methyltransferase